MRVLIAMDSLKGSLGSPEAGAALKEGILRALPDADIEICPLADGGEGTAEALAFGLGGTMQKVTVTGPLGEPVTARYGTLPDGVTAVMEMSAAAGITLVPKALRNPMKTTTLGVGEMIRDALQKGCRTFLIGIGGSATNDGGAGMLQALGFELLDETKKPIPPGAAGLAVLTRISAENALPELAESRFRIACDVENPLCGKNGASAVYGPQKGALPEDIEQMDRWLANYAALALREGFDRADPDQPGSGAAGGMGFAFRTFLDGELEPGARIVMEAVRLEDKIRAADIVLTGEGRIDGQTAMGKAPMGVAELAKKHGKPVIAFCGSTGPGAERCLEKGIDAIFPILREPCTLEEAMDPERARQNLRDTAEQVFRAMKLI
jgi:glycerate kinase